MLLPDKDSSLHKKHQAFSYEYIYQVIAYF